MSAVIANDVRKDRLVSAPAGRWTTGRRTRSRPAPAT